MKPRRNQSASLQLRPLILIAIGLILIVGALFWMQRSPSQPQADVPRPTLTTDPNAPFPNIPRVMLEDAKMALDGQAAVFLDVRSPEAYDAAHISGAINIPLAELARRSGELNSQDWIITYCT